MKRYKANGKLLLTGEYLVIDGALSLAVPCNFGQKLDYKPSNDNIINWHSFDNKNKDWFNAKFNTNSFELIETSNEESYNWLQNILKNAINLSRIENNIGGEINTYLEFPKNWGLGSSSTIISNIAQMFDINPFDLHFSSSNGSGYDIACATSDHPLTYQISNQKPFYKNVKWNPSFSEELFFVHLNTKQNSQNEVARYNKTNKDNNAIKEISDLTIEILNCNDLNQFEKIIEEHEKIISFSIKLKPIKENYFSNFNGAIKSLGAWGGDFILATGEDKKYFSEKGLNTILSFKDMVKTNQITNEID